MKSAIATLYWTRIRKIKDSPEDRRREFVDGVSGVFTPVLAKHSKSFSLIDGISVGVDRMQRNFEPMRRQEHWRTRTEPDADRVYCVRPSNGKYPQGGLLGISLIPRTHHIPLIRCASKSPATPVPFLPATPTREDKRVESFFRRGSEPRIPIQIFRGQICGRIFPRAGGTIASQGRFRQAQLGDCVLVVEFFRFGRLGRNSSDTRPP